LLQKLSKVNLVCKHFPINFLSIEAITFPSI
jgi:hypothetical protein